jgi:hypothetical protein
MVGTDHLVAGYPFISQMPLPGDGFPSPADAEHWRTRGCGIACLRMVLAGLTGEAGGYWSLVAEGLRRDAYCDRGWIHQGLVAMARDRGIDARSRRATGPADVAADVMAQAAVVASVTPCFKGGQLSVTGAARPRGGHLVLVNGVRLDEHRRPAAFRVHHPSATAEHNWQDRWIGAAAFDRSFNAAHMVFRSPAHGSGG